MIYSDQNPAPDIHDDGCSEWCNHCSLCGEGILYGARCKKHMGVYPEKVNGKLESEPCLQEKEFPMSTPIYDDLEKPVTTDATGEPTPKPTAKVLAGAVTGLALTVVVAVLTAITPDLLTPLGAWAGPAFAGIGALAVALGAYIKRPTGEIN